MNILFPSPQSMLEKLNAALAGAFSAEHMQALDGIPSKLLARAIQGRGVRLEVAMFLDDDNPATPDPGVQVGVTINVNPVNLDISTRDPTVTILTTEPEPAPPT